MYILKVREKDKIIFEKEYDSFEKVMKKFKSIDFDSGEYRYSIYKDMPLNDILNLYLHEKIDEFKDILND